MTGTDGTVKEPAHDIGGGRPVATVTGPVATVTGPDGNVSELLHGR
jgi:hypothetical protein